MKRKKMNKQIKNKIKQYIKLKNIKNKKIVQ